MKPSVLVTKIQNVTTNLNDAAFQSVNRKKNIFSIYSKKSERKIGSRTIFQLNGFKDDYIKVTLATQKTCDQLDVWINPTKEEIEIGSETFSTYNDFLEKHPNYDFLQDILDLINE
jgi:hypothetical protein